MRISRERMKEIRNAYFQREYDRLLKENPNEGYDIMEYMVEGRKQVNHYYSKAEKMSILEIPLFYAYDYAFYIEDLYKQQLPTNIPVIYFLMDEDIDIIYVGRSINVLSRLEHHRSTKKGLCYVGILELKKNIKGTLDEAERFFIRSLRPELNIAHNDKSEVDHWLNDKSEVDHWLLDCEE